jgi:hypothetical protein
MGFEPTIPVLERAKTVRALDSAAAARAEVKAAWSLRAIFTREQQQVV